MDGIIWIAPDAADVWRRVSEDMLIAAYVPEADTMTRAEALQLALERDDEATIQLLQDVAA